jgi:hypothetical protein
MNISKLHGMLKAFLLVNPQSESADDNVRKVIELLNEEQQQALFLMIKQELTSKLRRQIEALLEQINSMEE